jgi:hypothetical protein
VHQGRISDAGILKNRFYAVMQLLMQQCSKVTQFFSASLNCSSAAEVKQIIFASAAAR